MTYAVPVVTDVSYRDLLDDPYPIFRRLREMAPAVFVEPAKLTLVTRFDDIVRIERDPATYSADNPASLVNKVMGPTFMRKDGAEHAIGRKAIEPSFRPATIKEYWAPKFTAIANTLIDDLSAADEADLFSALAAPMASLSLMAMIGFRAMPWQTLAAWSQALIDGAGNFGWTPGPFDATDIANAEMDRCINGNMARVRNEPDSSALSFMVNAKKPIPESQIIANIKIAIGGGINEPRDALLTILYGLLTNPEQLEAVRAQDKWRSAFEEGVRWVAPIQASSRLVMEDTEIRGCLIPKGDTVMTIQASANRDEDLFEDGETYNALRDPNPHQSFGNGPHHCAGAHLSRRTVGAILLPMLFERFPKMTLPDPASVQWHGFGFRGPLNLPVRLQ